MQTAGFTKNDVAILGGLGKRSGQLLSYDTRKWNAYSTLISKYEK